MISFMFTAMIDIMITGRFILSTPPKRREEIGYKDVVQELRKRYE